MKRRLHNARLRLLQALNRNTILFTGGLLGVAHETLLQHGSRPTLLILFGAMMGLPAFLSPTDSGGIGFDRQRHKEEPEKEHKEVQDKDKESE